VKAWLSDRFSDEEGDMATPGKTVIIHGTRNDVLAIAKFLAEVVQHLEGATYCHMHLRDSMAGWSKARHVDLEITVDERARDRRRERKKRSK
jgi:hypothetical protein